MTTSARPSVRAILAALDGSERAALVLAEAATTAQTTGAQLFLLRVLMVPPEIPAAAHSRPDRIQDVLQDEARAELRQLMDEITGVHFGPPLVVVGDPWREILDVARDLDVDLIVMGSHGYHGLDRVFGTVAAKVVNHADRNVLVVHARPNDPQSP